MDIWSVLIIIGIAQGLFTVSLVIFKSKDIKTSSVLFIVLMLFLIWLQAEFLAIRWPYNIGIDVFYGTRYGSWFLLGPLFYLFVKSIGEEIPFKKEHALHFLPFIIFVLALPLIYGEVIGFQQVRYGMLSMFYYYGQHVLPIQYLYSIIFVIQFVHLLWYLQISNRTIKAYELSLKFSYADDILEDTKWLKRLSYYLIVIMVFVALFLVIFFFSKLYKRHMDYIYVLPMTFLMYVVGYRISGVRWRLKPSMNEIKKYEKSSLKIREAEVYISKLKEYINIEKPYLNNELRLQDLAQSIDIPTHHLSQILNHNLKTTFFDYINQLRVEEAKILIRNRDKATLLEIAFESGFNNKTSFTNAFKKYEGTTPSNYKRQFHSTNI